MAFLNKIEAAIALGISVELLEWFVKKCPKPGESRKLASVKVGGDALFDEGELESFRAYLRAPWPLPKKGSRPTVPEKIKSDVKQEAHLACAICGHMDNGEVAHIDAVSHTLNNSPENLIFLCPNHHTKFDLGFKPASNVSLEEIKAAKTVKRSSRVRIMRVEADAVKGLAGLLDLIRTLSEKMTNTEGTPVAKVYEAEVQKLLKHSSSLTAIVSQAPKGGGIKSELQSQMQKHAPLLGKLLAQGATANSTQEMQEAIEHVVEESADVLAALDDVECPHCGGRGTTGLVGDFCKFCRGSQLVSSAKAAAYEPRDLDEVPCPRCHGRGTTGLVGNYCAFCKGAQFVSEEKAGSYDERDLGEKPCPRCNGRGTTGLVGDYCAYCGGSMVVSDDKFAEYDPDDIDEVECPHCVGRGTVGLSGDECPFCRGSQLVSTVKAQTYDPRKIDAVKCPRCDGQGTTGLNGTFCTFCHGSQRLSKRRAQAYDPATIDETECPHCHGAGTTGRNGDFCKLCKGEQTVQEAKATEYLDAKARRGR